ncbi:MAG: hypothetical protein EXS03_00285 [Phycisphaerales bacterium]|nr:hypothetical protein [Phycisphaerales bacterium]
MSDRMIRPFHTLGAAVILSVAAQAQVAVNEVRVDQPGVDLNEYVEIRGAAGTPLAGLFLVVIGDDDAAAPPAQNGMIEAVVALEGSIGASGIFVVAEASYSMGVPDQIAAINLENTDNVTILLVAGFTGSDGMDLDTNDDGALDSSPWSSVLSSVALIATAAPDGVTADFVYSTSTVGPDGATSPSHAWRCADSAGWRLGNSDPAAGGDTPGTDNPTCGSGSSVRLSEIRIDMPGNDSDEYFELQGIPGTDLSGYTYIVIGDDSSVATPDVAGEIECVVPLTGVVIGASGYVVIAELTYSLSVPDYIITGTDPLGFENSDNVTHMLVTGFTGLQGGDVDADNDCTFDAPAPWASVVDSVTIIGLDTTCTYASTVGPDTVYTPGMVYRCVPSGVWEIGGFDQHAGSDTPGADNRACNSGPVLECGEATAGACTEAHANPYCSDSICCALICTTDPICCSIGWDAECVAAAVAQCNHTGSSSCNRGVVSFSEIRIDHTGTDTDEWFELLGTPGTSLADLTVFVIGDGAAASGVIEAVVSLAGQTVPADGHFSVSEATFTQGLANIDLVLGGTNPLNFENSDNVTFMLVRGFTGADALDLDIDNNGTLDATPWTELLDSIALIKTTTIPPTGTEWFYGTNTIGPDGTYVPGHIWRCENTGCWNIGPFDLVAAHDDTPGVANHHCAVPCLGDLDFNSFVDGVDLTAILAAWGTAASGPDINVDGSVDGLDLTYVLANWGPCD